MKSWFDPRYCPNCYQYPGDVDGEVMPEACKICFGLNSKGFETAVETGFLLLADIHGGLEDEDGSGEQPEADATGVLSFGDNQETGRT